MLGTRLGPYEIIEEVGRGGMAAVYRAFQPSIDRFVAIKVIEQSLSNDTLGVERFQREARLIARLEHVHILPVYDFDGANVPPYIVMRYLDGGTLKDILKRGQLPLSDIAYLFGQIASALDYSHRQGIVHRDIKPSNIMIDREGNAFVSDFGIARVVSDEKEHSSTKTGMIVGTPDYMAPEQVAGDGHIDHRADVYALGVMLFQMVTGELPFTGHSALDLMMKHLNAPVPSATLINPTLPAAIDSIIQRAMAKEPAERYQSVALLASDVAALAGGASANNAVRRAASETSQIILDRREEQKEQILITLSEFKRQRTATDTQATPTEQNKLVTALSLDAAEYSTLLEEAEGAESARAVVSAFLQTARDKIGERGGKIFSETDHALLALWGADTSREDDAENAVHAALAIQAVVQAQTAKLLEVGEAPPVMVGINTGIALLTPVDGTGDYTASGATITVANKLSEQEDGSILISQDTFRTIQGVFDMESDAPLKVRGRKEPLLTYRVLNAKSRAFRLEARGVHGVETAMIGREAELKNLQNGFEDVIDERETRVVTVIGAPGVGKSRLLYEFARWGELHPAQFRIFRGRATSNMTQRPYALLRDMLSFRFEILDNDPLPVVRSKLEAGVLDLTGAANPEMAHLIGHLIGFDMSDSPSVNGLLSDPAQIVTRGRAMLKKLISLTAQNLPIVLQIEDAHLADDSSLAWLSELALETRSAPLLIVVLARPELLERLPDWSAGQSFHTLITMKPLSRRESRALVAEVLKRLPEVPLKLRDTLVEQAEGNPYFIEETTKMLIEDRVIVVEGSNWRVEESRLEHLRVPPTLFALLQARLDTLLYPEKLTLQRASVVGRIFYDSALAALDAADENHVGDLSAALRTLAEREFITPRPNSAFAGSAEYIFAQNMLRDAIYSTLLKRQLKSYHAASAGWLVSAAGERLDEYLPLIAEHYELGGDTLQAAAYLNRAGQRALKQEAYREARTLLERALALLPNERSQDRVRIQIALSEALRTLGESDNALSMLRAALDDARLMGDADAQIDALNQLGLVATNLGHYDEALAYVEAAYQLAQAEGSKPKGLTLFELLNIMWRLGDIDRARMYAEEGLKVTREEGNRHVEASILAMAGMTYSFVDRAKSDAYLQEALSLARRIGHRGREASVLTNLGYNAGLHGDSRASIAYTEAALAVLRELEDRYGILLCLSNLSEDNLILNDIDAALPRMVEVIHTARRLGMLNWQVNILPSIGEIHRKQGDLGGALAYKGLYYFHPMASQDMKMQLEQYFAEFRAETGWSEAQVQAAVEAGRTLNVDAVIDEFLSEYGSRWG